MSHLPVKSNMEINAHNKTPRYIYSLNVFYITQNGLIINLLFSFLKPLFPLFKIRSDWEIIWKINVFLYFLSISFQFLKGNWNPMKKDCLPKIFLHRICVEMKSFQSDSIVTSWNLPNELVHCTWHRQLSVFNKDPLGEEINMHYCLHGQANGIMVLEISLA